MLKELYFSNNAVAATILSLTARTITIVKLSDGDRVAEFHNLRVRDACVCHMSLDT